MKRIERRTFLKLAGLSGGLAAAASLPSAASLLTKSGSSVAILAEAGMPARPLPSMATHILEGWVDAKAGTGRLTSTILAGHPGAVSEIALPGLTRQIQVNRVHVTGDEMRIYGSVTDRSQLMPAESPTVNLLIDRLKRTATGQLRGHEVTLQLVTPGW
jgi:hypothetical protein